MAPNSRPRSDSSASNKRKKYQYERAHTRSRRQVSTGTPRVLETSRNSSSPAGGRGSASRRSNRQNYSNTRTAASRRSSARAGSNASRNARNVAAVNQRAQSRKRGGIGFKIGIAVLIIALLVGGFVALYFSSLFTISDIQVAGNEKLKSEYVTQLAEVPTDSTFLRTDTESIEARLLAEPWIQEVSIERVFPGTLILHITERPVAAIVDIVPETANESTTRWVIAEDGTWIAQVDTSTLTALEQTENNEASETDDVSVEGGEEAPADESEGTPVEDLEAGVTDDTATDAAVDEDTRGDDTTADQNADQNRVAVIGVEISAEELVEIPKIKDVSAAVRPVEGQVETDEGITNALTLLREFSDEMRSMVASISAPSAVKTTLTLHNFVGVGFGVAEDIEAKEQAIATLLAEHEGAITYINVHVADRATYRATE